MNAWSTHSDISGGLRYGYIIGLGLSTPFTVRPEDILGRPAAAGDRFRVVEYWHGFNRSSEVCDSTTPFILPAPPASGRDDGTVTASFHVFAPVLPNGWTVLGEPAKLVAASSKRFAAIRATATGVSMCLVGSPAEEVTVLARTPSGGLVQATCTIPRSSPHYDPRADHADTDAVSEVGVLCFTAGCTCMVQCAD